MKNQLNRELIEGLNESSNEQFFDNVNSIVYDLISKVVSDISAKSPFIRVDKCILQPVNEIYTGAFAQLSEYDYFLGVENTQIEFNSKLKKNFWQYAWREFRAAWRLGKKKYKKNKQGLSMETIEKYKLSDFRHDVFKKAADYLTETSLLYEHMQYISIVGKDDFGTNVKINIYICVYDSNKNIFKLYNEVKNKFLIVDFGDRFKNLSVKRETCGNNFVNMIKIFNALFSKVYNKVPNQILIESLIFNTPDLLFDEEDIYKTFVNIANYIRLANPRGLVSICDANKNIFEETLIYGSNSQIEFGKIITMLDRFKW